MGQIFSTLPVCTGESMRFRAPVSGLKLLLSLPTVVHHCQILGLHLLLGCALWSSSIDSPCILRVWLPSILGQSAVLYLFLLKTKNLSLENAALQSCATDVLLWVCTVLAILEHWISLMKNALLKNYLPKNMLVCHRLVLWMRIHPSLKWIYMPMLSRLVFYWGLCVMLQC